MFKTRLMSAKSVAHGAWLTAALFLFLSLWTLAGCSDETLLAPLTAGDSTNGDQVDQKTLKEGASRFTGEPEVEVGDVLDAELVADKATRVRVMYATDVDALGPNWINPNGADGAPAANDNQNSALYAYNDMMSSSQKLEAWWFNYPTLQAGERITAVYVDVNSRYDAGTSADAMRLTVDYRDDSGTWRSVARDASWTQTSSDDLFRWRMGGSYGWNITNKRTKWAMNDVMDLFVDVRRFPNNDPAGTSRARVNAFRIVVVTSY